MENNRNAGLGVYNFFKKVCNFYSMKKGFSALDSAGRMCYTIISKASAPDGRLAPSLCDYKITVNFGAWTVILLALFFLSFVKKLYNVKNKGNNSGKHNYERK